MDGHVFWFIDSDEYFLPETYYQADDLRQRQRDVFSELHYGRYTYYPVHDRARIDRSTLAYR